MRIDEQIKSYKTDIEKKWQHTKLKLINKW